MNREEKDAILRLFNSVLDEQIEISNEENKKNKVRALKEGIIIPDNISSDTCNAIIDMYGLKSEQMNSTFHKAFKNITDTSIQDLYLQQLLHYITTYTFEDMGIYDESLVYLPHEKLEIPEITEDVVLKVITSINKTELNRLLMDLLSGDVALSNQTIKDVEQLILYIKKKDVDKVKNREIKNILYDIYNIVPKNNIEFFRYLIYKTTGSTLLIKNDDMFYKIKGCNRDDAYKYIKAYIDENGLEQLAYIFLRYKKLFLAYKSKDHTEYKYSRELNRIINKLDKIADIFHSTAKKQILDELSTIKTNEEYEYKKGEILDALKDITIFREIRINNGLRYRYYINKNVQDSTSIVYKIRNGKAYATKMKVNKDSEYVSTQYKIIMLITTDLSKKLNMKIGNKVFYIPDNIRYTAPVSEKKFIGNIPEGSYVEIPRSKNMVFGIHWFNIDCEENDYDSERVDFDLKLMNDYESIGWNELYFSDTKDIIFSGDVTDAPRPDGATELFLVKPGLQDKSYLIKLNNYTCNHKTVPFEFIVGTMDDNEQISANYMINPNNIILKVNNAMENNPKSIYNVTTLTLGMVEILKDKIRIYFTNYEDIVTSVSHMDDVNRNILNYNKIYNKIQLTLTDLLMLGNAKISDSPKIEKLQEVEVNNEKLYRKELVDVDYDLSIDKINKDTFIKMFS